MRDAGFTLTEALVSLAVLAMLSLMLLSGLAAPRAAWARRNLVLDRAETLEIARQTLHERLQRAAPVTMYDRRPPGPDFEGLSAQVEFVAPGTSAQGAGGLRRYRLSLDAQSRLMLESRDRMALDQRGWPDRQVLLTGVRSLDLAYFGAAQPDMTARWRPRWSQQASRPDLVRIRLAFAPGDSRVWPELLIRPLANIDTECALDRVSKRCKGR
ncbi:prepilin-type N-terminal cleavage/methylation domain-containing protein [Caulobacter sp. CCNWLY153]|uniref:prepilin-type N-terminal cleavage/methylation domain-containing protein n=1 Tax=unclassified Caulobacter TaxID=2648921 RepID=UPI002FEF18F6